MGSWVLGLEEPRTSVRGGLGGVEAWGLGGIRSPARQCGERRLRLAACALRLARVLPQRGLGGVEAWGLAAVLPHRSRNKRRFLQPASRRLESAEQRRAGSVSSRRRIEKAAHDCRALRGLTPSARGCKNRRQRQYNRVLTHAARRKSIDSFLLWKRSILCLLMLAR